MNKILKKILIPSIKNYMKIYFVYKTFYLILIQLEKYKAEKANKVQGTNYNQRDEISDEESFQNDKSIGHRESYVRIKIY